MISFRCVGAAEDPCGAGALQMGVRGIEGEAADCPGTALTRGVGALASGVARGVTGMTEDTAQRVGQYLMSADPAEIRSLTDLFLRMQNAASQPRVGTAAIAAGTNAPRDRQ